MQFIDRHDAGKKLAEKLTRFKDKDTVIFALPRGGVPVAFEVAKYLNAPMDMIITKKIGNPFNREYAVAAVTENGFLVMNKNEEVNVVEDWFVEDLQKAKDEAARQRELYFGAIARIQAEDKTVIIVDDGLATGLTMEAAVKDLRTQNPKKIILAAPVAPIDTIKRLSSQVDEIIILMIPDIYLGAVGAYYIDFEQVNDQEVLNALKKLRS